MSRKLSFVVVTLFALAALEFGVLGARAAGITGRGGGGGLPPIERREVATATATANIAACITLPDGPCPTPINGSGSPASIELSADKLQVTCGQELAHVRATIRDAAGLPVPDGWRVAMSVLGGFAQPPTAVTSEGVVSANIGVFSDAGFPNVIFNAGELEGAIHIRCKRTGCAISPPSVSPPCPTPFPCNPSPGAGPMSPPCATNTPVSPPSCSISPPSVSPPCATPTPVSPPTCSVSPPSVSPPCATPTPVSPPSCSVSPPSVSPPCATATPTLSSFLLAIDCDLNAPGVQNDCAVTPGTDAFDVGVVLENGSDVDASLGTLDFQVHDSSKALLQPLPGGNLNLDGNPDLDQVALGGDWTCLESNPDTGADGPTRADSSLSCLLSDLNSPAGHTVLAAHGTVNLAKVHYRPDTSVPLDGVQLTLGSVAIFDSRIQELLNCGTGGSRPGICLGAVVRLGHPRFTVAIDCDVATAGIQSNCNVAPGTSSLDVAVVLTNNSGADSSVAAFNFVVHDSDTTRLIPVAGANNNLDGNPDFNQAELQGAWTCTPPAPVPDTGSDGSGKAASLLSCFIFGIVPPFPIVGNGQSLHLANVHYAVPASQPGTVQLTLGEVAVSDAELIEMASCNPVITEAATCAGATVTLGSPSPPAVCGDVNGDGKIDALDLLLIGQHMGKSAYDAKYDLNHDGRVNAIDLLIAAKQRGKRCPQAEALAAFG